MGFNFNFTPKLSNFFGNPGGGPNFQMPEVQQPYNGADVQDIVPPAQPQFQQAQPQFSPLDIQPQATPAADSYRDWANQYPSNVGPTKMDRFIAALGGGSAAYLDSSSAGMQFVNQTLNARKNNAYKDWAARGEGLKGAASIESQNLGRNNSSLSNMIRFQSNTANQGLSQQKIDLTKAELDQKKINAVQQGWKVTDIEHPDGNIYTTAFNPITNETTILGRSPKIGSVERKNILDTKTQSAEDIAAGHDTTSTNNNIRTNTTSRQNNVDNNSTRMDVTQAQIDAAAARQEQRLGATAGTPGKRNVSGENKDEQNIYRNLALKYPNVIKQTSQGKFYAATPEDTQGWWGHPEHTTEYQNMLAELQTVATTIAQKHISKPVTSGPKKVTSPNSNSQIPIGTEKSYQGKVIVWDGKGWKVKGT